MKHDVKGLRKALGVSREDLARFLCVSSVSIVRWESDLDIHPHGLQLLILTAIDRALFSEVDVNDLRALVKDGASLHMKSIHSLFNIALNTIQPTEKAKRRP